MEIMQLVNQVLNGETDALKAYIELKRIEKELEFAINQVQPLAISEADKYPGKSFEMFGAFIEKKNAPARWDYSMVTAYQQQKAKLDYIQKIAQAGGGYDSETSEEIAAAAKVEGKSTITVKFAKNGNLSSSAD